MEELRRMLDERGVEHEGGERSLRWRDRYGIMMRAFPLANGELGMGVWSCTPKQAIAATLGSCSCTNSERTSDELLPCPFCGWHGIHMRKKTRMRRSVTGFMYMRGYDQFDSVSLGYVGQDFREEHCYDYRFGIRFYCGKCKAETPYVWGEWHLPTEDEVETFDDLPHACERFDPDEERVTIDKAIAAWNRRAES